MTKYYGDSDNFTVRILDYNRNPQPLAKVNFNYHGIIYHTKTDLHGYASYPVSFKPGEYNITTKSDGALVSNKISILDNSTTIESNDLVKYYGEPRDFTVRIFDWHGNPKTNTEVSFNFNGEHHTAITNEEGYASIPINLRPGEYPITTTCAGTSNVI